MVYCTDASAIRVKPNNPPVIAKQPVPIAPPRRPITKTVAAPQVAKPKATTAWRSMMQSAHRRAEAIAAQYAAAGKAWGRSGDAGPGVCYEEMMAAYEAKVAPLHAKQEGVEGSAYGENYNAMMQRYDGARGAVHSPRDPADERKSAAAAKAFHDAQIARNERFAASLKVAANEQWRHK